MAPGPLEPCLLAVVLSGPGFLGAVFSAAVAEALLWVAVEHIPGGSGAHPTTRWRSCLTQTHSSTGRVLAHSPRAYRHPRVAHWEGLRLAGLRAACCLWMAVTPGDVLLAEASRARMAAEVGSAVW